MSRSYPSRHNAAMKQHQGDSHPVSGECSRKKPRRVRKVQASPDAEVRETTARKHQPGYADRMEQRQRMTSPHGRRGSAPGPGPAKGPSKRAPGVSSKAWSDYMSGKSSTL